ncbi:MULTISPECIES: SusC/RagA family TonB-linked outer membrane protein [Olivibacter]|uniref:SusC/RagA family TonB-linked outer membrane protein n=1 Tax=Olivibacter jilunii TaxID=985016 RepID=A0ABW6B0G9_9SPHI|nr:SusC/RagA family TonB-linked outer membrane protein [Olivibacter sp. UJ_SKK_5.1]MDX3911965.1 SusC/RagA family TonB-linked outer membrane protein [Pseudosphingobacterium sp.]
MKQKLLSFFLASFLLLGAAYAQERTIRGKVTSQDGEPLPGVSVVVSGTTVGTQTNQDGNFSLNAPSSATSITVSYIGFASQVINLTASNEYNISLAQDEAQLSEVVVTALGIKRERKALGYATQEVKGTDLTVNTNQNVLNNLSGRVSGAQITSASGAVGSSTRIVLRGNNSFGNNQPLFVIDGVPIDNSASTVATGTTTITSSAVDFGSGIQDLDPNNIESMNVLKGANAAALYGSRAANGVIVITTKKGAGEKGIGVTYSGGISFEKPYILPKYQNKYGQGQNGSEYYYKLDGSPGNYNDWAIENGYSYVNGAGAGVNDGYDESWGPRLDAGLMIPQFNSPLDENGNRIPTPWISHPNNVRDFFRTGLTLDNNVAFTSTSEKGSTRFSYTNQTQKGTIPNTDQKRNTIQVATTQNLTDKLVAEALVNYVRIDNDNLIGQGYNSFNPMNSLGSWFGRQVDLDALKANQNGDLDTGAPYNWISVYHDNPFASVNSIFNQPRVKDRVFGYASIAYKFHPWFNAQFRVGNDVSWENRQERVSERQIDMYRSGGNGSFRQTELYRSELNADLLLTGSGNLNDDFSLSYTAGANLRDNKYKYTIVYAPDLTVPGIYNIGNVNGNPQAVNRLEHLRSNSLFGQASIGYKSWLYLDVTARNDWSSTLPSDNWSYFYPSASLSWIFTDALGLSDSFLNYGKLRGSWAQVGNATNPYQTLSTYLAVTPSFGGIPQYRIDPQLPPLELKPEKVNSTEIGLELGAFNSRLRFDATYYNKITTNQIMAIDLPKFGGASTLLINAGEIQNKGLELQLGGTLIKKDNFSWDMNINWAYNRNKVNELYTDPVTGNELLSYPISNAWGVNVQAVPGEAFGVIRGSKYRRTADGALVVNPETFDEDGNRDPSSGLLQFDTQQPIGNITPDWVGGISNSFSYKNFNLSFLVDFRKGGDFFSVTDMFGAYTGVLEYTAEGDLRENGVVIGQNVLSDFRVVTPDGQPNNIVVSADDFFANTAYNGGGTEFSIIDGSFIKLRNINLSYSLPKSFTSRYSWLKGASVSIFANNVALLYTHKSNRAHIDPETGFGATNEGLGLETYQIPPNRSIGLKLNVAF